MSSTLTPITDSELRLAESGSKRHLLRLSSAINSMEYIADRIPIAYKWAFISALLGHDEAKAAVEYLRMSMTDQQVKAADRLVDDWIDRKHEELGSQGRQGFTDELTALLLKN